jgi:hypothetical protein
VQKSAGKFLTSIFGDQDCSLHTDYLPKCQTINAQYCSSLLAKRCGRVTKINLHLYNNAPANRALATQEKLPAYLGFQYLDHTPYSPDLAPPDYRLFPRLTNIQNIQICQFLSNTRGHSWHGDLVGRTSSEFVFSGLEMLEQRAKKCV